MSDQRHPTLEELKQSLRARICAHCHKRPPGSGKLAADCPRSCEESCAIFRSLPRMQRLAYLDPMVSDLHQAAERVLCETCAHGSKCAVADAASDCPERRYRRQIIQTIEQAMKHTRE